MEGVPLLQGPISACIQLPVAAQHCARRHALGGLTSCDGTHILPHS